MHFPFPWGMLRTQYKQFPTVNAEEGAGLSVCVLICCCLNGLKPLDSLFFPSPPFPPPPLGQNKCSEPQQCGRRILHPDWRAETGHAGCLNRVLLQIT